MTVSATYRAFILEQLGRVLQNVRARSMFGGVGIYSNELFFALMGYDTLYFKVDDQTRPDFEARGLGPFRPFGEGGETMQYYEVSADIIEDLDALRSWGERAVDVARRAKRRKSPRSKTK